MLSYSYSCLGFLGTLPNTSERDQRDYNFWRTNGSDYQWLQSYGTGLHGEMTDLWLFQLKGQIPCDIEDVNMKLCHPRKYQPWVGMTFMKATILWRWKPAGLYPMQLHNQFNASKQIKQQQCCLQLGELVPLRLDHHLVFFFLTYSS